MSSPASMQSEQSAGSSPRHGEGMIQVPGSMQKQQEGGRDKDHNAGLKAPSRRTGQRRELRYRASKDCVYEKFFVKTSLIPFAM